MRGEGFAVDLEKRIRHGILLRMGDYRSSGEVELHADFAESRTSHDCSESSLLFGIEHEKPTSAGADEFAAESAVGDRKRIQLIDFTAAHPRRPLLLVLPVNIHYLGEFP